MPETELFPKSCKILRKKNTKSICLSLFIEWNKKLNIKVPLNMFLTTFMTVSDVNVHYARSTFCLGVDTACWTSNIGLEYFFFTRAPLKIFWRILSHFKRDAPHHLHAWSERHWLPEEWSTHPIFNVFYNQIFLRFIVDFDCIRNFFGFFRVFFIFIEQHPSGKILSD